MGAETYTVVGKWTVTLTDQHFISEGGEGRVFGKESTVYKIYLDHQKMIPAAKVDELRVLEDNDSIIGPQDLLIDKRHRPAGYTMTWVHNAESICKLFATSFRKRVGITPESTMQLVENLIETIAFIHEKKCLIVDGNEFNFLVYAKTYTKAFLIDVDSYQTPSFPATAIMPYVRDWQAKEFSSLSDWFTFAILACQLFVGIHPFKGRHPSYDKRDVERRMKDNVSIFNKQTKVPSAVRDYSYIPSDYYNWFVDLFEKGKRLPPPKVAGLLNITAVPVKIIRSTEKLEIELKQVFDHDILEMWSWNNVRVIQTLKDIYIQKRDYLRSDEIKIILTIKSLSAVGVCVENAMLQVEVLGNVKRISQLPLAATNLLVAENSLFVVHKNRLTEVVFDEFGQNIIPSVGTSWEILPNSTRVFDGLVISNALGNTLILIPTRNSAGKAQCLIKHIPEFDGYRIIDAKHDRGVVMCFAHKDSGYRQLIIRIDQSGQYDFREIENNSVYEINFVTLTNGVVVSVVEDGVIEVFKNEPQHSMIRQVHDAEITSNMKLCADSTRVGFFEGSKLYSLRMTN